MSGNGRAIGSVVGAIVGAYFTGGTSLAALGPALGGAAGGAIGGMLDPAAATETNRIEDIKVSVSVYGDGIPETWGTNVPKATWIWSTDILQIGTTVEGKGGGSENTNYRQFLHGYVSLGRTPPEGTVVSLRKTWVDGKLRYDASSGMSASQALATEENPFAGVSIHEGFDAQLPHPIIEQYEGVGNVPAFKGVVGLFIFGLECPGGRIPQIAFELSMDADLVTAPLTFFSIDNIEPAVPTSWATDGAFFYRLENTVASTASSLQSYVGQVGPGYSFDLPTAAFSFPSSVNTLGPKGCAGVGDPLFIIRTLTGSVSFFPTEIYVYNARDGSSYKLLSVIDASMPNPFYCAADHANETFVVMDISGTNARFLPSRVSIPISAQGRSVGAYDNKAYMMLSSGDLEIFDDSGTLLSSSLGPLASVIASGVCVWAQGVYAYLQSGSTLHFYKIEGSVWTELGTAAIDLSGANVDQHVFYCSDAYAIVGKFEATGTSRTDFTMVRFNVIAPSLAYVADIIESQSLRAGLTAPQFDVSTIDDTVWGYTMPNPASARANVAPMLTYGAIGVVEEDGLMRYFHRAGRTYVATISYDELGCVEYGNEPGDPFPLTRTNADELPRSITVSFNNPYFDYQISTQGARRDAVDSVLDESVELNIAMEPDKAATIARRMLFERWMAQMTRTCVISRKYIYLSAGDVIRVEYPRGTYSDWMISGLTDTGLLLEIGCFPADGDLLIQTVPGSGGFAAQEIAPLVPPTRLELVDTAILRDEDSNAGVYAAMSGMAEGWHGAELFVGDDDPSLVSRGTVALSAPTGFTQTALGAWTLGVIDETNLLTVNVNHHELTSITQDELLTGTENVAAVGDNDRWEIIKFQRATLITPVVNGSNRYILSGLLRGQRGTEWARGTHTSADKFVVLSQGGVLHPSLDAGSIGQIKYYRAVSNGRSFDSIASQTYASTAEGLVTFSPTNLVKSISSGDITFSWNRRTRLSENWLSGVVPLGEASESFEVDLFTSSGFTTVRRTITSTTASAVYTAAMQSADGYVAGSPLYVRVYQISDTTGRGHELQATI